MIVIGDDFKWGDAIKYFENLDNLISLMRSNEDFVSKYRIKYSTANEYYDAVKICDFPLSKTMDID